jgi:predicted ester cyclase
MSATANTDTLNQAIDRFNAKDLDGFLEMYQPSVMHHGFSRNIGPGLSGLRIFYRGLIAAFPDARIQTDDVVAEGEKLAHRYTFYGTHRGEYVGFPPTMKLVMFHGQVVHHFKDGKSMEVWASTDVLRLLVQLGAPDPVARRR